MSQSFSGTLHQTGSAPATAVPISLCAMVNTPGGQNVRFVVVDKSSDNANVFQLGTDVTSTSNKVSAYQSNSGGNGQVLTSTAITTNAWQHVGAMFGSGTLAVYLNGGSKGSGGGGVTPSGINQILVSGRPSDFTSGIGGPAAHIAAWTRLLSDNEWTYLGIGGSPRAIKGCVSYWKESAIGGTPESPIVDQIGTNNLTASGTFSAGASDPNFQTFRTGSAVGAQSYTNGTAITSINLAAGGPVFDNVSSAFTVTLQQLGSPSQPTTTSSGLTAVREVVVGSASAFSAGDYMKITSGGTPTRVLGVNTSTNTLLVADDQTYSNSSQVFRFAVNSLTVPGLSISSNVFSGTPTANATNALCFFRAACNGSASLMADSDLFTITITGGSGGGGLQMPAGAFCGGFIGG